MQITFKLYATLTDHLPQEYRSANAMPMQVKDGATPKEVIDPFGIEPRLVHLVLVNGRFVPPEARSTQSLEDGDVLAVWPPIAGG